MLGIEPKPNDNDRFKPDSHDKGLDKLGYKGLFGAGLGAGLGPMFGTSLGANLSASLSASFGANFANSFGGANDHNVPRDGLLPPSSLPLDRTERLRGPDPGRDQNGTCGSLMDGAGIQRSRKESGVELVKPSLVYDIASLILYRCQALPIRLKIALDRLFSVLTHEDVLQVLHGFGWTYEDYSRGYMLQDQSGAVLHKWNMVTAEEESILLQQFLRFGETKNIVQQLLHQDNARLDRVARDVREARDLRDSREREGRDNREYRDFRDREVRHRRDQRDHISRENKREFRETREDMNKSFLHPPQSHQQKHMSNIPVQQPPPFPMPLPPFADPTKPLDPEQIKKLIERNMLFSPFLRGAAADPSALLRPHHSSAPPSIPPNSPFSNLLAVNPSLASSLLTNPHLASSLSMLRLPVPPVSLPNLSPSNGSHPVSFGGPTSPMGGSPLNRLQNMQPFDFRKERKSPSPTPKTLSGDTAVSGTRPSSNTAISPNSNISAGSISGGISPSSGINPVGVSAQPSTDVIMSQDRNDCLSEDDDSSCTSSVAMNLSTTTTTDSPMGSGTVPGSGHLTNKEFSTNSGGPPTPPKRSWNPINMGTSLINPVTGKKRVQCNVCLKTFCDKGALKIHFSAVHLREMHKCTVEGCNMMFSSRRSRNRHSANPNPKLHTPHVRRKISPHDGRTCNSHPVILPHTFQQQLASGLQGPGFPPLSGFPGQFGSINPLTGLPFLPQSNHNSDIQKQAMEMQRQNYDMHGIAKSMDQPMRDDSHWKYGSNSSNMSGVDDYQDSSKHFNTGENKKYRYDNTGSYIYDEEDDNMSVDASSFKGDGAVSSPSANKRKRKNQNPTKFAFRLEDDDLICTDDDDDDENDELDDIDEKDSEEDKNEDKELDAMSDVDDEDGNGITKNTDTSMEDCDISRKAEGMKHDKNESEFKHSQDEQSNALRHLENLSKGKFSQNDKMVNGSENPEELNENQSDNNNIQVKSTLEKEKNRHLVGNIQNEELETRLFYSDGFLSNVEVPVDKENPRKCVSCEEIFSNIFAVKSHYQTVHLKLIHKCSLEWCNAAFLSRKSRDRHSMNLSIHRNISAVSENSIGPIPGLSNSFNPELLARLYSDPASFSLEALKAQLPSSLANTLFNKDTVENLQALQNTNSSTSPFFLHNLLPHLTSNNNIKHWEKSRTPSPKLSTNSKPEDVSPSNSLNVSNLVPPSPIEDNELRGRKSISPGISANRMNSSSPPHDSPKGDFNQISNSGEGRDEREVNWFYNLQDDLPSPDRDGKMPCRFCYQTFDDGEGLKQHYECMHKKDLFKCTIDGCNKAFSSRRKRNNHELNNHNTSSETKIEV